MAKTAIERTLAMMAPGGAWHGRRDETAKGRWFVNRVAKRAKKKRLEQASRKRNR